MGSKTWILILTLMTTQFVLAQTKPSHRSKKTSYEEVNVEDMIHRYFGKDRSAPVEGIYSVSCVIVKQNKRLLSKRDRIRVVGRQDNYARVAIMKDWPGSDRDYIEISLSIKDGKSYPIVGELDNLAEGNGFIYKHIEPDGAPITFSMMKESEELLEAEYSSQQKRQTVTYKLSYLKIYPKAVDLTVSNH